MGTQSTWGVNSEDSLEQQYNMYTLILTSLLAVATCLPIEDTPEVAAAKAEFSAAFAAAEKGEHAALAPVNTGIQAPAPVHVIPEPAALAAAPAAAPSAFPYGVNALNAAYPYSLGLPAGLPAAVLPYSGLPFAGLPAAGLSYAGLPAAGVPYAGLHAAGLPYAGLPYNGLLLAGYPYAGLPVVAAQAEAKAEE